jgi:hypothetical protein
MKNTVFLDVTSYDFCMNGVSEKYRLHQQVKILSERRTELTVTSN